MTKIKLCGLSRRCDIEEANSLLPEYVGFVFAKGSSRFVSPQKAKEFRQILSPEIKAVGVFVKESPEKVAEFLNCGIIDIAQLHGGEDEGYIEKLRGLTHSPIIKAFRMDGKCDIDAVCRCSADHVLLDSGAGTGRVFDWELIRNIKRPYFLAGGLDPYNVSEAVKTLAPYAVDVSSGIESGGFKDRAKMADFVAAVRKEDRL